MLSVSRRWKALLGGALALASAGTVSGQVSSQNVRSSGAPISSGGQRHTSTDLNASGDSDLGGAGTSESSLTRDAFTAQETFFRTFNDGIIRTPKLGYGLGKLSVSAPLGASAGFSPFRIEGQPDQAELKFGNFYLDILTLSGSLLYSDNSLLTEADLEPEPTSVVRLEAALIYQINPAMQLTAAGAMVWLPFKSEVGFSDPQADYTGNLGPLFQTQFSYDIPFNKVDVQFLESFAALPGGLGVSGRAFDLLDRGVSGAEDPALLNTQSQGVTDRRDRNTISYKNNVGANVSTVLPTVTRLTFGYVHENIWQSGGTGQESSSDSFSADLRSERENLRFKPYFNYTARHQSDKFGYDSAPRGGIEGPITENLELRTEMGYFLAGDESGEGYTWRLALLHRPRERINHQLILGRTITYPDRSFGTVVGYTAQFEASQDILIELAAQEQNFEPLDNPNNSFGGKQFRTEGRLRYRIGRRVVTQFGHAWVHAVSRAAPSVRFDQHTLRFDITTQHTLKLESKLVIQNETRDSNTPTDSYTENVISLTLSRKF
jgi:hypothetical protein